MIMPYKSPGWRAAFPPSLLPVPPPSPSLSPSFLTVAQAPERWPGVSKGKSKLLLDLIHLLETLSVARVLLHGEGRRDGGTEGRRDGGTEGRNEGRREK